MMEKTNELETLELQVGAIQVSIFCNIIKNILLVHRNLSVVKMLAFAFIIKKNKSLQVDCFSAKHRSDLVIKFLSQGIGRYNEFCTQLPYIFQAIDLLIKNNICEVHEDELFCKLPVNWAASDYGDFTNSAIKESQGYTDRQFLTEVINIV